MTSAKVVEKKGHSVINQMVMEVHHQHYKRTHGVGFRERAPWALKEIWKFAVKEMGSPAVWHLHQARKSRLDQRDKECSISHLSMFVQKM